MPKAVIFDTDCNLADCVSARDAGCIAAHCDPADLLDHLDQSPLAREAEP